MKHKDPFLGEIDLILIHKSTKFALGCAITEEYYKDSIGNWYIFSFCSDGINETKTIKKISKEDFELLKNLDE